MRDLYYGSISEREYLANAISNKGVQTNASDTLTTMADNVIQIIEKKNSDRESDYCITPMTGQVGSSEVTINIKFNREFSKVPKVIAFSTSWASRVNSVSSITTTSFNATISRLASGSAQDYSIDWIAIVKD